MLASTRVVRGAEKKVVLDRYRELVEATDGDYLFALNEATPRVVRASIQEACK